MDSEEGVTYSPSEIGEGWVFTGDAENTIAYLLKLNRMKGKKSWKITLGLSDYFTRWVAVSFKELLNIINTPSWNSRERRFHNCEITLTYHVSLDESFGHRSYISVWPTVRRDENKNYDNNWGEEE